MTRPRVFDPADEQSEQGRPEPPAPAEPELLALQRAAGNQAVGQYLQRTRAERGEKGKGEKGRAQQRRRERDDKPQRDGRPAEPVPDDVAEDPTEYDGAYEEALKDFSELAGEMDFSHTGQPPRFDERFWKCTLVVRRPTHPRFQRVEYTGKEQQYHALLGPESDDEETEIDFEYTLESSATPSVAIRSIYTESERWSLDCIDFVVAARLYAECVAKGDFFFDLKYRDLGRKIKRGPLKMAQHATTGLTTKKLWLRGRQGGEFRVEGGDANGHAPTNFAEEDQLLATLPIGSRAMWTSSFTEGDPDMENENTIKVGRDLYAAHPLGTVSAAEIRDELVVDPVNGPSGTKRKLTASERRQQSREHIYLSEVEIYDRH